MGQKKIFSSLVDLLQSRASSTPDETAFIYLRDGHGSEETISYAELEQRARLIAMHLGQIAKRGDRALINHMPGLEYIASFFGCLYAGITAVPVYPPRFNPKMDRLKSIVMDVSPTVSLTPKTILQSLEPHFDVNPALKQMHWIATDSDLSSPLNNWVQPDIKEDNLAFIQYTSGSTSSPKGVMLTHANLLHNLIGIQHCFQVEGNETAVFWLPPYHDMGLIGGILEPIYTKVPTVLLSPYTFLLRPFRWLQAITKYKASYSGAPNFAYDLCVRRISDEQIEQLDLSHWQLAFCGAEPVRSETLERFTEKFSRCGFHSEAFYPCYGLAEATLLVSGGLKAEPVVTCNIDGNLLEKRGKAMIVDNSSQSARKLVSCGKVIPDHQIRIIDPLSLKSRGEGQVGEIWLSGPSIAVGYWNREEETRSAFCAKPVDANNETRYFRTGDLGFLLDNELYVTGRIKDLIIIRGRNYYPQDIEFTVENSHPLLCVASCAAISVENKKEEKLVIIQEVDRKATEQDLEEIITSINRRVLEDHGVSPSAISLIKSNTIPVTSSGKIQRHTSRHLFLTDQLVELKRYTAAEALSFG